MGRGPVAFAILFILLPLLGIAGAWVASAGAALGLVLGSLALLLVGFTLGLFLLDE